MLKLVVLLLSILCLVKGIFTVDVTMLFFGAVFSFLTVAYFVIETKPATKRD